MQQPFLAFLPRAKSGKFHKKRLNAGLIFVRHTGYLASIPPVVKILMMRCMPVVSSLVEFADILTILSYNTPVTPVLCNGDIEIGVHIADVTYFVPHNSPLDLEAQIRGTTFYLVDRRFDMLPTLLSSGKSKCVASCPRLLLYESDDRAQ